MIIKPSLQPHRGELLATPAVFLGMNRLGVPLRSIPSRVPRRLGTRLLHSAWIGLFLLVLTTLDTLFMVLLTRTPAAAIRHAAYHVVPSTPQHSAYAQSR
ncbi:hypothetical protein LIA77_03651 [Sarocladium implicatum]|nr:hypothetical protein LIA77_03651 [Sarocladium implicatum]